MSDAAPRRRSEIDLEHQTVVVWEGDRHQTFELSVIPERVRDFLALDGLRYRLRVADDPAAAYADLRHGQIPTVRVASATPLDPWREAIAHALLDARYPERDRPTTKVLTEALEECRQVAQRFDRVRLMKAKGDPKVIAHHARITGIAPVLVVELAA